MTVSEATTAPQGTRQPSFWYGLPVGYVSLHLHPPAERLMELVAQLHGLPEQERDEADRALRLYTGIISPWHTNRVQEGALGVHPNDSGGFTTSVFTVSTMSTAGNSSKLVMAGLVDNAADSREEGTCPLELPCGLGVLSEKRPRTPRPSQQPEVSGTGYGGGWCRSSPAPCTCPVCRKRLRRGRDRRSR